MTPDQCGACLALTIHHDKGGPSFERRFCAEHQAEGEAFHRTLALGQALQADQARTERRARRKLARSGNPAKRAQAVAR